VREQLADAFGSENVHVREYRPTEASQAAFLRDFFALAGTRLPDAAVDAAPLRRLGVSEKGLRLMRAANPLLPSPTQRRNLHTYLLRHFSDVDYPRPALLTSEQHAVLAERYGPEYEQLIAVSSR
jgi:hypothetical protein